jgi:tryptophanyl-tRNA synthetase
VTGRTVADLEQHFAGKGYGDFKRESPRRSTAPASGADRYAELRRRPGRRRGHPGGAERAREVAAETMADGAAKVGFLSA